MSANMPHAAKKKPDKREERLHKKLVCILRMDINPGIYWFHPANGEKRHISTGVKLKEMGVRAGAPDLVFLRQGHFYGLELKADGGSLENSQRQAHKDIVDAGGTYAVAKGIHAALDQLIEWQIITRENTRKPKILWLIEEAA